VARLDDLQRGASFDGKFMFVLAELTGIGVLPIGFDGRFD